MGSWASIGVEIGGIAQLCAAAATHRAGCGNCDDGKAHPQSSDQTRDLANEAREQVGVAKEAVDAARDAAEAARQEATATEGLAVEARTDRQVQWQPRIELVGFHPAEAVSAEKPYTVPPSFWFSIRNNGAGPALNVVIVARLIENVGIWSLARMSDLRPDDEPKQMAVDARIGGPSLSSPFDNPLPGPHNVIAAVAVFCRDVLDHQYRFVFSPNLRTSHHTPSRS